MTPFKTRVLIYGAGNEGRIVYDILRDEGNRDRFEPIGFRDDFSKVSTLLGLPVRKEFLEGSYDGVVLAIGNDLNTKLATIQHLSQGIRRSVPAISSSAYVAHDAQLADSVILHPRAVVMTGARIGHWVTLRTGATIDHDCVLEDYVNVSPGVVTGGGVKIRRGAFIGLGAVLFPGVTVGSASIVGAGAIVRQDVDEGMVVVGHPARLLRRADK